MIKLIKLVEFVVNLSAFQSVFGLYMFIKRSRVQIPTEIEYDNEKIIVVDQFKLLGAQIDNKLNFDCFVTEKIKNIKKDFYD